MAVMPATIHPAARQASAEDLWADHATAVAQWVAAGRTVVVDHAAADIGSIELIPLSTLPDSQ